MAGFFTQKKSPLMSIKRKWIAGILITLTYWCSYQGFEGFQLFTKFKSIYISAVISSLLIVTGLLGVYGFWLNRQKWTLQIWIIAYSIVTLIVGALSVSWYFLKIKNSNLLDFMSGLRMFFTSPVPYGIVLFLERFTSGSSFYSRQKEEDK